MLPEIREALEDHLACSGYNSDGYIFASNNKIKEGNAYSYILPQTLSAGGLLIDRRKGDLGGKGLEVLMLEVNPYEPKQRDAMVRTIEEWFSSIRQLRLHRSF